MKPAILFVMSLIVMSAGCGDEALHDDGGAPADASVPDGKDCVTDADCNSARYLCAYRIADGCAAQGHCAPVHTPTCAFVSYVCGCNGQPVSNSDCFYEPGFAAGPTTGAQMCADGGI